MSRPLKTPSMRWEFAFCSSGYVLVSLYTLGALGLNCERVREQRWRAFVTPPPRRERPSVSCRRRGAAISARSLGRKVEAARPPEGQPRAAAGPAPRSRPGRGARSGHATRAQGRARRRRQWWWLVSGSGAVTGVARSGRCGRVSRTASGCGGVAQSPRPGGPASSYEISGATSRVTARAFQRTNGPSMRRNPKRTKPKENETLRERNPKRTKP